MNDARNVRRAPKTSYATVRSRYAVLAAAQTCSIPPNTRLAACAQNLVRRRPYQPILRSRQFLVAGAGTGHRRCAITLGPPSARTEQDFRQALGRTGNESDGHRVR
jgi:hypothetical protein